MEIHIPNKDQNNDCSIALFPGHLGAEEREEDPKQRTVEKEREDSGWRSWTEARVAAADRDGWGRPVDALCATTCTRHEAVRYNRKLMNRKINKISEVQ